MENKEKDNFVVKKSDLNKPNNKKILRIIGNIVFWLIFVVFLVCAVTSYVNFTKVEDNKEPSYYHTKKNYTEDDQKVVVYDYYVYKIVRVDDSKGTKVSLKLWFLSDLNKKENK